ncbi:hypothetical protein KP509_23G053700 [Ceratopteris richardii]|nr:hypothetical protein KP509_23G053700 [Ceratopteris richardii]
MSNFAAYAYAPAILVTPLGAVSIIVSAVLAHLILNERLHSVGLLGCFICLVGSVTMVLFAPEDQPISSVQELWDLATQTDFVVYVGFVFISVMFLMVFLAPHYGRTHVIVCISICSLTGSLTVMSIKAIGIAIKLTFEGDNQFFYPHTWFFVVVVVVCGITQLNYLNKALDAFDTAVVSLIYYVMFTSFTILASVIMFKSWQNQAVSSITLEMCGFVIILFGMTLLLATKGIGDSGSFKLGLYAAFSPSLSARLNEGQEDLERIIRSSKSGQ